MSRTSSPASRTGSSTGSTCRRSSFLYRLFPAGHFIIGLLFLAGALALIGVAAVQLWQGVQLFREVPIYERLNAVLESIAVLTFRLAQDAPHHLPYAASIGLTAAEQLEPEAMQAAKREDRKIEKTSKGDGKP
jgi:hypothetical protein